MTQLLASSSSMSGGTWLLFGLFVAALVILEIAGYWKTFKKAGHAGWLSIIPIVNIYVLIKIAKRPGWWLLLYIIPLINLIASIVVAMDVAKAFKKSTAFGVIGLWVFPFIGYLMLGFGDAQYGNN